MAPLYASAAASAATEADSIRAVAAARADSSWATLFFLLATWALAWSTWAWLGTAAPLEPLFGTGFWSAVATPVSGSIIATVVAAAKAMRATGRTGSVPSSWVSHRFPAARDKTDVRRHAPHMEHL
jgi:hypothetical protein